MVKDESVAPAAVVGWGLVIAGCILGISFFDSRTHPLVFVACTALAAIAYLRTLWLLGRFAGGAIEDLRYALCSQRHGEFPFCSTRQPFQPMSIGTCGMAESSGLATILT